MRSLLQALLVCFIDVRLLWLLRFAGLRKMDRRQPESLSTPTSDASVDLSPLLGNVIDAPNGADAGRNVARRSRLARAFRYLRRTSSRRIMREPSARVRETAVEQLEERQTDWANSKPVVVLDLIWNLAFVIVAVVVLLLSREERPDSPLRVWVVGYAAQCCVHMTCVCLEYRRRHQHRANGTLQSSNSSSSSSSSTSSEQSRRAGREEEQNDGEASSEHTSIIKRIESANTTFSFVWWVVGFYWTTAGVQSQDSPLLFWLCVIFLAFDVFFVVFCVALACIIGVGVCCCLPCIIAIMYAVAEQEGASEEVISSLPKFKFRRTGNFAKVGGEQAGPFGGVMSLLGPSETPVERDLPAEDAECCICLSAYEDGIELRELPCGHHFHCACIDRWLRINSTCPLCKDNIGKSNNTGTGGIGERMNYKSLLSHKVIPGFCYLQV